MIPGLDPKKMAAMMKQMGIKQEEISASRVIIEQDDGKIIINNPSVLKVNMQGNVNFQISGDIEEQKDAEESSEEKLKSDIKTIVEQTGVSEDVAAIELEKNEGDIAATIISLSK
jgi:alpha-NAC-related protein